MLKKITFVAALVIAPGRSQVAHAQESQSHLWNEYPYTVGFQARWEVTRSDFANVGSQTDSFKENWLLETPKGIVSYLVSPRAKVPIFRGDQTEGPMSLPSMIFVEKDDLSRLLGIPVPEVPLVPLENKEYVTIPLHPQLETVEYALQTGDAEFFLVQLQINY
ncbi:MAG: hypothetical protein AB7T49_05650 [Oligoflexales bacterium]